MILPAKDRKLQNLLIYPVLPMQDTIISSSKSDEEHPFAVGWKGFRDLQTNNTQPTAFQKLLEL